MIRAARNIAGFLFGWLLIIALALGMESAHAEIQCPADYVPRITVMSASDYSASWIRTSHPIKCASGDIFGSYGSFLGACFRPVGTVIQVNSETSKIVAGSYSGTGCNPTAPTTNNCEQGGKLETNDGNNGAYNSTYRNAYSVKSECVLDPNPPCPVTTELDEPKAVGTQMNNSASYVMCQSLCQIAPFAGDDNSGITTTPLGGSPVTIRGNPETRWKITGVCPTNSVDERQAMQAEANAEKCQVVQGEAVCTGGSVPKNCVKINGGLSCTSDAGGVCTDASCTAAANAVKNADGSATAKSTEPTPKAPNTGTAGQRATPDLSYSQTRNDGLGGAGSTNGYDWFAQGTVAGSYNGDGSIGDQATETPTDPECDPATEECPGEPACDPATEECPGEEPEGECAKDDECKGSTPALGEVRTFAESIYTVQNAFSNSPLMDSLEQFSIPEDRFCPTFTIPFNYGSFSTSPTISFHCTLGEQLRPQIRAFFICFWILVALFVFMRP